MTVFTNSNDLDVQCFYCLSYIEKKATQLQCLDTAMLDFFNILLLFFRMAGKQQF
jgi:hypothetical protein